MASVEQTKVVHGEEVASTAQSVAKAGEAKKSNRRGKASRENKFNSFGAKKNDTEHQKIRDYLSAKWGEVSEVVDSAKSTMLMGSPMHQPPREVEINVGSINEICRETYDYMRDVMLIPLDVDDLEVLQTVAHLQVRAKVSYARINSPFGMPGDHNWSGYERTMKTLNTATYPMAFYLSNIGSFEYQHQLFVPQATVETPNFRVTDRTLLRTSLRNDQGEVGYLRVNAEQRANIILGMAAVNLNEDAPVPIDMTVAMVGNGMNLEFRRMDEEGFATLVARYKRIIQVMVKKHSHLAAKVEFEASGTIAQLVGCNQMRPNLVEVGCIFKIPDEMLAIGGNLKFGLETRSNYHDIRISHITRCIDPASFWQSMQAKRTFERKSDKS